jgi:hypothetical protein
MELIQDSVLWRNSPCACVRKHQHCQEFSRITLPGDLQRIQIFTHSENAVGR